MNKLCVFPLSHRQGNPELFPNTQHNNSSNWSSVCMMLPPRPARISAHETAIESEEEKTNKQQRMAFVSPNYTPIDSSLTSTQFWQETAYIFLNEKMGENNKINDCCEGMDKKLRDHFVPMRTKCQNRLFFLNLFLLVVFFFFFACTSISSPVPLHVFNSYAPQRSFCFLWSKLPICIANQITGGYCASTRTHLKSPSQHHTVLFLWCILWQTERSRIGRGSVFEG